MKKTILLVTAKRSGTEQTKDVALDLTSYIPTLKGLRDYYKESFVKKYASMSCSSSGQSLFNQVLLGTVKTGFEHGKVVESVEVKAIDTISDYCRVATLKHGFELTFYYVNVGSYLKVEITHEMIGIKSPNYERIAELHKKKEEIEKEIATL